jgi:hypothetical protein
MLSRAYIEAMSEMTQSIHSAPTIFEHRDITTAYKPATMLTDWEKQALKAHIRYFFRRNYMNGVFRLKATPNGWYIEKVQP